MAADCEPASACDPLERSLESGVLERLDLSTVLAHEVVVMLSARAGGLEAGHAVAQVDPLDEPELIEALESAIDAGDADAGVLGAQPVVDLLCRHAASLAVEELDDDPAGVAAPSARGSEARKSISGPCSRHRR